MPFRTLSDGFAFTALLFLCFGSLTAGWKYEELERFKAPEARQGVAVDSNFIYVIGNHEIGKYDRESKKLVDRWACEEGKPLIHLNAGLVREGKLICAHSNYPLVPMMSSVETWDAETLEHIDSVSLGHREGSLTWFDWKDGFFYMNFAHYANRAQEQGKGPEWTQLVKFDDKGNRRESWVYPPELVEKFGKYSSSGGAFGPDGRLYITGHDNKELYVVSFPAGGSYMVWEDTTPFPSEGQAFVFDPEDPTLIFSIIKREREVIIGRLVEVSD